MSPSASPHVVKRTQHAVGQGFFHSQSLTRLSDLASFEFIYDCGAIPAHATDLHREIDSFFPVRGAWGVDLLVLSHAHFDHVSGLPRLLSSKRLPIRRIIMPLLSIPERLIAFAQSFPVASPTSSASSPEYDFYVDFTVDPHAAIRGLAAVSNVPEPQIDALPATSQRSDVNVVNAGVPVRMSDGSTSSMWELRTHVTPAVAARATEFFAALAFELTGRRDPRASAEVKASLEDPDFITVLLGPKVGCLRAAYRVVSGRGLDVNVTSLSLYSGPSPSGANDFKFVTRRTHGAGSNSTEGSKAGWLGTGDARLRQTTRRREFLSHFDDCARNVGTLTLPHHGSDHNFHAELINGKLVPAVAVATVGTKRPQGWHHPGAAVTRYLEDAGISLQCVEDRNGPFVELVSIVAK